jgi:hypothetical protein
MTKRFKNDDSGFAALVSVVALGAVCLVVTISASRLSLSELEILATANHGQKAAVLAASCLEEGLMRLRYDPGYRVSGETVEIGDGSCVLDIVDQGDTVLVAASGRSDKATAEKSIISPFE